MQGIPAGFALTTISNYLVGANVSPHLVGTFIGLVGLPWTIQFAWGPIIDRFQYSAMGPRKQWLIVAQIMSAAASAGLLWIHDPVSQLMMMTALFVVHSIFASLQDASVDAMAIAIIPKGERGRLNAAMRGGYLAGIAIGSAGLSYMLHAYGFRSAALSQTLLLIFFSAVTFFTKINRTDSLLPGKWKRPDDTTNPKLKFLFKTVYKGITQRKNLDYFLVVVIVYFCLSIFIRSFSYHLIHVLAWPDKSVSMIQGTWGSVITLIAVIVGGIISDKIGPRALQVKVMWGIGLFLILLNATFFLWNYQVVPGIGLALWNLADPMFSVAAFPILMALCSEKVEGSQFTAYMAIINLCDVLGSYISGWTLAVIPTPVTGVLCGVIIIVLISLLRKHTTMKTQAVIPSSHHAH